MFGTSFIGGEHVFARTLETGRAAGYYTHSGKGEKSAKARFEPVSYTHLTLPTIA